MLQRWELWRMIVLMWHLMMFADTIWFLGSARVKHIVHWIKRKEILQLGHWSCFSNGWCTVVFHRYEALLHSHIGLFLRVSRLRGGELSKLEIRVQHCWAFIDDPFRKLTLALGFFNVFPWHCDLFEQADLNKRPISVTFPAWYALKSPGIFATGWCLPRDFVLFIVRSSRNTVYTKSGVFKCCLLNLLV